MRHILQTYYPLYNKDASDHIIERHQQQFHDNTVRHTVKLPMEEYYDSYAYYLMLEAYINDSSKTLVDPTEILIFFHCCIRGKDLFQATCFDLENNNCKYKFLPHNLVQTLLLEFSQLPSDRLSSDRSSDLYFDRRFDGSFRRAGPRRSYTSCRSSSASPTVEGLLPKHQNDFLTKVINAVKIDPRGAFTPDCI